MKTFNLAEERIQERRFCRDQINRRIRIAIFVGAGVLLFAMASFGFKYMAKSQESKLHAELQQVNNKYEQIEHQIATYKSKISQTRWLGELAKQSSERLNPFESVLAKVSKDIWLKQIETEDSQGGFLLLGNAKSYDSLSLFISRLRSDRQFADVSIGDTRVNRVSVPHVSFTLHIKLKAPFTGSNSFNQVTTSQEGNAPEPI